MARGHLVKRSEDSWSIVVELERDPTTGKRHQKWSTVKGTKREADKRLTELLTEADRGAPGTSPKMTVADFLDRWIRDYAEANCAPKTILFYRGLITRHIVPHVGRVQLSKFQSPHVLHLQTTLRDSPRGDGKPGVLSPTTRRHAHRVLHTALESAVKWKMISINPAASVDAPAAARVEMRAFTAEQASAVLVAATDDGVRWQAFFTLAMTAGLRLSELVGLRWQDINLQAGSLSVRQTIQRLPHIGIVVKAPKTPGSRRPIALGGDVVALLRRHRAGQAELRLSLGSAWHDNDLVFPSDLGTPIDEGLIRRAFKRICQRAGVEEIRLHDLRHSCATLLLTAGVNPKVVSERLGHSSINITLQTYSHVGVTMQQAAAETMDTLLRKIP